MGTSKIPGLSGSRPKPRPWRVGENPKVTVRLKVDAKGFVRGIDRITRRLQRGNWRRRPRFRWLCWVGFHWWEGDIKNDWRVIEEKCRRCGKERTLRLKTSVVK